MRPGCDTHDATGGCKRRHSLAPTLWVSVPVSRCEEHSMRPAGAGASAASLGAVVARWGTQGSSQVSCNPPAQQSLHLLQIPKPEQPPDRRR